MKDNLQPGGLDHIKSVMDDTETVEYDYDGHYYSFTFKTQLDWSTKLNLVMSNLKKTNIDDTTNISEEDLNLAGLYTDLISEQVVDSNVEKLNLFLKQIPDEFGEQLAEDIADTVGLFDDDSTGNLKKL